MNTILNKTLVTIIIVLSITNIHCKYTNFKNININNNDNNNINNNIGGFNKCIKDDIPKIINEKFTKYVNDNCNIVLNKNCKFDCYYQIINGIKYKFIENNDDFDDIYKTVLIYIYRP